MRLFVGPQVDGYAGGRPGTQARLAAVVSHGLGADSDLERRLGELVTVGGPSPEPGRGAR